MTARRRLLAFISAAVLCAIALPAAAQAPAGKAQPLRPPPAADALKPGLLPQYFRNLELNHVDELVRAAQRGPGAAGAPVATIDAGSGSGEMWESQMPTLWGVRFDGLIRLERGEHYFVVNSNDGVRVFLGGPMLVEDPDVHADRLSNPVALNITEAGWYPLVIWYFQKRNTATLQLLWQPPGAANFAPVPAERLAHKP